MSDNKESTPKEESLLFISKHLDNALDQMGMITDEIVEMSEQHVGNMAGITYPHPDEPDLAPFDCHIKEGMDNLQTAAMKIAELRGKTPNIHLRVRPKTIAMISRSCQSSSDKFYVGNQ